MNFEKGPTIEEAHKTAREQEQEAMERESSLFSRFQGKAGKIARAMVLVTALSGGGYEAYQNRAEIGEGAQKIEQLSADLSDGAESGIESESVAIADKEHKLGNTLNNVPEEWRVYINLDGVKSKVNVSKEIYDSMELGDKVDVTYDNVDTADGKVVIGIKKAS